MKRIEGLGFLWALLIPPAFALVARAEDPPAGRQPAPAPLSESAARMELPPGFHASLFAGEPDVRQPIALEIDDRGRIWVAECYSYPDWKPTGSDRILIFEDVDQDGKFDKRTVFADHLANVSGLALGFGGVYVCATPNLLFIPDADGDDRPDSPATVLLDGWSMEAEHNVFNSLTWGPDGRLYGTNGILATSLVGKPGTPERDRTPINCGVWRFHPVTREFEVVASGTTNPWGLDFDERGDAYITNCVIPHLFPVIPGGHFQRMFGRDLAPFAYELMPTCADHIHWAGGRWQDSRGGGGVHDTVGGGHAHSGAMVYLGDNWPDAYRGNVFMSNIHGNRINRDRLERTGSSVTARHEPDFLRARDQWFRCLALKYGPTGSVFLIDWSDTDECHDTDANGPERSTGRIYEVWRGEHPRLKVDLRKLTNVELVGLLDRTNKWFPQHARRILHERAAAKVAIEPIDKPLTYETLWAMHVTGQAPESVMLGWSRHADPEVRRWFVKLATETSSPASGVIARMIELAGSDDSVRVRQALASALPKVPREASWSIAERLVRCAADADDRYQPLLVWYGVASLAAADPERAVELAKASRLPTVTRLIARRLSDGDAIGAKGRGALAGALAGALPQPVQAALIEGMREGLAGRRDVPPPARWSEAERVLLASRDPEVREPALEVSLVFGNPAAAEALERIAASSAVALGRREQALEALLAAKPTGLAKRLEGLLDDPPLRGAAIRALGVVGGPETPSAILKRYKGLTDYEKMDAVAALAARRESTAVLLDAVASGAIPRRDVSTAIARQIQAFQSKDLSERLERVWGHVGNTSRNKVELIAKYKKSLGDDVARRANAAAGRRVFARTCGACHRLFDSGGEVGPDLTGSNRKNLDYLLENIIDPSATVAGEFKLVTFSLADGRLISGIIRESNEKTVVVQTVNQKLTLPREDIEETRPSSASIMPEGQLESLSSDEVRDLVGYLAGDAQVPLPEK